METITPGKATQFSDKVNMTAPCSPPDQLSLSGQPNAARMGSAGTYVLVTPARNEVDFIELTIKSMIQQTVLPLKWVIVSDGSTDGTDEIVRRYAERYPWLELIRMGERTTRDFAGKVGCFNKGYDRVQKFDFDYIGSLDADLSFQPNYFEFLLSKFPTDPKLGLIGTPFSENGKTYDYRYSSTEHVSGACQLFRRAAFQEIGGYVPIPGGGIDDVANVTCRLKGWKTRTFTEKSTIHHRPMGAGNDRAQLVAIFKLGRQAYRLGWHPMWQLFRSLYQMTKKPFLIGGFSLLFGYSWAAVTRESRPVSKEVANYQRRDQMLRLRKFLFR